jgi:hypothetical protein
VNTFAKLLYRPLGIAGGMLGGLLAGALFKRMWKLFDRGRQPPKAMDEREGLAKVVLAATVKGAVFGGIKAVVERAGATGFANATGVWPGSRSKSRA